MKLKEWLFYNKVSVRKFALDIQVNKAYVHMWLQGRRRPSEKIMEKVRQYTNNEVQTQNDLLDTRVALEK